MTIRNRNFTSTPLDEVPFDTEYVNCNFGRQQPDLTGPQPTGHKLFPGELSEVTFRECNLMNIEPPPNAVVDDCNTTIKESFVPDREETLTIDGVEHKRHPITKSRVHGRWNAQTRDYEYKGTPDEVRDSR
jgi:hypothetical protein